MTLEPVSRKINDMSDNDSDSTKGILEKVKFYFLDQSATYRSLDESTDIDNISELLIFIRIINGEYHIHEEMFKLKSL